MVRRPQSRVTRDLVAAARDRHGDGDRSGFGHKACTDRCDASATGKRRERSREWRNCKGFPRRALRALPPGEARAVVAFAEVRAEGGPLLTG